jgi:hypothetical protein
MSRSPFSNVGTGVTGVGMTEQTRKFQGRMSAAIEPERLPAELHYIAADIRPISSQAAELLRSAACQLEADLRARRSDRGRPTPHEGPKEVDYLRLVT